MTKKIRTLNLAYTLPDPPFNGYDLRHLNLMHHLADSVDQTLMCRITHPLTPQEKIFCEQLPYEVRTVLAPRPAPLQKWIKGLRFLPGKFPVMAGGWYFKEIEQALQKILSEEQFDFIVLEGIWSSVYWKTLRNSSARLILNLYDLESGLLELQAGIAQTALNRWLCSNGARRMARLENNLPAKSDLTWVVSDKERQFLLEQNPDLPVYLARNGVDCDAITPCASTSGKDILFVGSLQYFPNVDGVQYLIRDIMPEILKCCPDATLRVIGRQPDDRIKPLHNPPSIEIIGEVEDLEPYYRTSNLCIVPLRSGGGTRLKILEAMAYGRPVVSTTIGAEGTDVKDGLNILIADTPTEIAKAVCRLLEDPDLAKKLAAEGRKLVENRYSWKSIAQTISEQYRTIINSGAPS